MVVQELKEDKVIVEQRVSVEIMLKTVQEEPLEEQALQEPVDQREQRVSLEEGDLMEQQV